MPKGRITKHNRKLARSLGYKNITEAREGGVDLPDDATKKQRKALIEDAAAVDEDKKSKKDKNP